MELGPEDANGPGALAGKDAELFGLGEAAPEGQLCSPHGHPQLQQDRIAAAIGPAAEQIDVDAAAAAIPGLAPGRGACLKELDQIAHHRLLGRGAIELLAAGLGGGCGHGDGRKGRRSDRAGERKGRVAACAALAPSRAH
jgi:hypothetical protein